ncbi:ketopantoate reductase family protein [Acuticoccus mangrovi]|uniref:2-dehydropantoate 2-reductase n=1 Tax=Acuticoccus mangrovi TaxID=2796142 RepID=A0A934IU45_9HYPH|nr:2-dehydropantoate 2-reductase [Acuticoccus mangrovi]MBJ3778207.1 2-dehydropantoate 2-reductase [Acuticoccus mangrovi]
MRIVVMGAGAVGGYFGGRLAAAGTDVTLIARGAHLAAIQRDGLRIESPLGDATVPVAATEDPAAAGTADIVLVLVKLYDTAAALAAIRPLVGPATTVLSLQNGIDAEAAITEAYGADRAAGGAAYIGADVKEPGVVRHSTAFARLVFGAFDGSDRPALRDFASAMAAAGLDHLLADDIRKRLWDKFIFLSAFSAVTSLARLPIGPILDDPAGRALYVAAIEESLAVARHHESGIAPDFLDEHMSFISAANPMMRSSMLDDLTRGKRLEIEGLSGRIVALGEAAGIPTPVHRVAWSALRPSREGIPA